MKKILILCLAVLLVGVGSSCAPRVVRPDQQQLQEICQLATLDCYYHNVCKFVKEPGDGFFDFLKTSRTYWVEYEGVVTVGIQMSEVEMQVQGKNVTVTLPKAEVLGNNADLDNAKVYVSEDRLIFKNKITAEEQSVAVAKAQEEMQTKAAADTSLLQKAQTQAKDMIQKHIQALGKATGVSYKITWKEK